MLTVRTGNLFESTAQTLVNTVNCVGVMGAGIALEFKNRFPEMFLDYQGHCARREVELGRPYLFKSLLPPWILNFPTKDHWRSVSRIVDIIRGLEYVEANYQKWGIESLAVPPLGCGHGGLEWKVVGPTLFKFLSRLDIPVEIFAPLGTPEIQMNAEFLAERSDAIPFTLVDFARPHLPAAWIALAEIVARINREPYHWPIGRTTFQKIAYFATQLGLPTTLQFERGSYGPFSPILRRVLTRLVNNGLLTERRMGQMFVIEPGQTQADSAREYATAIDSWEPILARVTDLFSRLNTRQAEIAATVDFVARSTSIQEEPRPTELEVVESVMKWKQKRRPPLSRAEVSRVTRSLNLLGWTRLEASADLPVETEIVLNV